MVNRRSADLSRAKEGVDGSSPSEGFDLRAEEVVAGIALAMAHHSAPDLDEFVSTHLHSTSIAPTYGSSVQKIEPLRQRVRRRQTDG